MPEELLKRTGKRGAYGEETKANFTLNADTNSWEVFAVKKPKKSAVPLQYSEVLREGNITDVKRKRKEINADLLSDKRALVEEIKSVEKLTIGVDPKGREIPNESERAFKHRKHIQELAAHATVNYQIEGSGGKNVRKFKFSKEEQKDLEHARKLYQEIVPLDKRKEELNADIDDSDRKIYDALRAARNQHRVAIAVNNKFVNLSDIKQITNSGLRLSSEQSITEYNDNHKANIEKIEKKINSGERLSQGEQQFYDGAEGKSQKKQRVVGYAIPTTIIKPGLISGATGHLTVAVSIQRHEEETFRRITILGAPPSEGKLGYDQEIAVQKSYAKREAGKGFIYRQSNRLYFYREGNELIVGLKDKDGNILYNTNIGIILANALKKQGTGSATIYINNTAFSDSDFTQGLDGRWRLTPMAETELNATEIDGRISARLSDEYQQEFKLLSETTKVLREKAPTKIYGQSTSTAFIPVEGGTNEEAIINYYSVEANIAVNKELRKAGEGFAVVATDFSVTKQNRKLIIALDKIRHSGIAKHDLIFPATEGDNSATQFYNMDKFLILEMKEGKLIVTLISPDLTWSGIIPFTGKYPQ